MCSIPGLPTPGSEVPVLITRANLNPDSGLVELCVNLDDERKHVYEKMREEIQTPQRKFYESEGKPGDLCLVSITDTWHRARIVSTQSEDYNLFLIDQGQPHTATREALAWGQCESFLLPPETESCILSSVIFLEKEWPEKIAKFLRCLPGKKFKGLVHHVLMPDRIILLEIPIISKHMCMLRAAKKVSVDKFKTFVQNCLRKVKGESSEVFGLTQELNVDVSYQLSKHDQYFYPELSTDTFEKVYITEVTDPQNIFCKLLIFSKTMKALSEQIHQHYEDNSDFEETQPQSCGDPCATRGKDGRWYRSLLKQSIVTSEATVDVFHVDEGKAEPVNVGDVKPLLGKFLRMPVVTYLCSMSGIKQVREWTADEADYLKSLLLEQTVTAKFDLYNKLQDFYHVTLNAADGSCINNIFLERPGFIPSSQPEQVLNVQNEPSSFPMSLGSKRFMDLRYQTNENASLEETWPSPRSHVADGGTGDISALDSNDIYVKPISEAPYPLLDSNRHFSAGFLSEVEKAHGDDVVVRKSVDVKVSCIESPQKFWCQTTESNDSLIHLMEGLQSHYAAAHSQPLVDSICAVRNPENGKWYRARIITSHDCPVVDVRFIDYGQTGKIPLRDVHPIDPAFLKLNAQAFQCCLLNPIDFAATACTDADVTEFQRFVESNALKCTIKGVTYDDEGVPLNLVDIESGSESACKLLSQCKHAWFEDQLQVPPLVSADAYNNPVLNIDVGGKEKVLVTSSENVRHFYCQLCRNLHVVEKIRKNVAELLGQPRRSDCPLGLKSACLARYTDNQWYRGQIVEMSPQFKVYFVDYGDTLVMRETDVCPFPSEAVIAKSVPVQAVLLELFNVPSEIPQVVNQWFSDQAVGHIFMISVAAKGEKGKLIVELFDGSLNVNALVRDRMTKVKLQNTGGVEQPEQNQSSNMTAPANKDCSNQDPEEMMMTVEQNKVKSSRATSPPHHVSTSKTEQAKIINGAAKSTLDVILEDQESEPETSIEGSHLEMTRLSPSHCPEGNVSIYKYTWPNISPNTTEEVFASCIVGPHYFWCQYANTTDLNVLSKLAQEAGQTQEDGVSPEMLEPGTPCLALFSSDNQWYRAQVMKKSDDALNVLFVDYGNESEIDINKVKLVPQSLLKMTPQAFLCRLNDFKESNGSWEDIVYDDFYDVIVDKLLKVTVFNKEIESEREVLQYTVKVECDNVVINDLMHKHWKPFPGEYSGSGVPQLEALPYGEPTEDNTNLKNTPNDNTSPSTYRKQDISKSETELAYASCILEPGYFWCQFANTDDLHRVSRIAQEVGQAQQDEMFPQTLGPGSPCLALFSSDNQWYRAQVIRRTDETLQVLFIDYGNESEVNINDVRPLTRSLQETAPQAFLCQLNGYDKSKGSWDDEVYDDFYNLLVDKPLKLTVFNTETHSEIAFPQYSVGIQSEGVVLNAAMQKYWKPDPEECAATHSPDITKQEDSLQASRDMSNVTHSCISIKNVSTCLFKEPMISRNKTELAYASCIAEPGFFWCQFANTEDLHKVSQLAQEAGQAKEDEMLPQALGPGSPCLALFPSDNQWYRAQVIQNRDETIKVLFIDYGNESEVDISNVRPLPQSLLETAPQAFLCRLNGFDESKGSWDDEVYDDFYNLLVDKLHTVTVFNMEGHPEIGVPQYAVELETEGVVVNAVMEKNWKAVDTLAESLDPAAQDETRTMEESFGV